MTQPAWTAIIVNYNGASYLGPCLAALAATDTPPGATIVVDNASSDDSLLELHAFPRAEVLAQTRNLGFAGGANVGLRAVETEYALLLNPDVEIGPDFGAALLDAFDRHPRLAAGGALLTYPTDARIQHAGGIIDRPLMTTRHRGYGEKDLSAYTGDSNVDFVTGGAMALRMDAVNEVRGFDEQFSPVYYEDVDLCIRLRAAGWHVKFVPSLQAAHHEGVTLKREPGYYRHLHRNRIRFALKHLSQSEWAHQFVPAELARLRHELAISTSPDDVETSGAAAIEAVLRGRRSPEDWNTASALPNWPVGSDDIDAARQLIEVAGSCPRSRIPLVGWIRRKVNDLGPRWYVDPAFEQQRAFNAAIVHALETHERMHREQTAALLLVALDELGRLNATPGRETPAPPAESEPEPSRPR